MKLSTQKTVAKAVGGVAVAGALVYGLSAVFSGDDAAQVATRPPVERQQVTETPQRTPPVTQNTPAVETPARRGDTPEEKAQKIADLQRVDAEYLSRNGFAVRSFLNYGACAEGGGLENTSWRGIASGMSYSVDRDGATYQACVSHRGGKAIALTSNYSAAVAPAPRVEQPVVRAPAANAPDVPFNKGTSDAQRDQKLADMRALDGALLANKGMTLVRRLNVGEACSADGTIAGETKWKGTASSIQYEARLDGQALQVCINHKGGKPTGQVTGSALRP